MHQDKYSIVLDDDPAIAKLIQNFTQMNCISFQSGQEILKQATACDPIAIFVDIHFNGQGLGLELIPKFRSIWPSVVLFALTSNFEPEPLGKALAAGASDFIAKPLREPELLLRLLSKQCEMSLRGAGELVNLGKGCFNIRKRFLEGPAGTVYLSPLQTELLQVLVKSEGMLLSKELLKKSIWGKISVSDNALDRRISEMRKILKDSGIAMQIVSEYGKGIYLQSQEPHFTPLSSA